MKRIKYQSQFDRIKQRSVGIGDELWEQMAEAIQRGEYKNMSTLVRIAVVELLGGEK